MNKFILLAAVIGAVYAVPTVPTDKVTSSLATILTGKDTADIMITFAGSNTKIVSTIENQSFATRTDRLNTLKNSLKAQRDSTQQRVQKLLREKNIAFKSFWISNEISIRGATKEIIQTLAAFPEIEIIDEEQIIQLSKPQSKKVHQEPNPSAWGIIKISGPDAWRITNGTGIVVANTDGGVRHTHETLRDNYRTDGYGWFDPGSGSSTPYSDDHGTHTMGTIAGSNGIGVAPGAQWMACQGCQPSGSCPRADLTACGEWTLCPTRPDGTGEDCSKAPVVSSNSWGGGQGDLWYEPITEAWIAGGIIPVFAIGNSGSRCNTANSPGDLRRVIGVGATDSDDAIAYFSSVGPSANGRIKPDISAPGEDVYSAGVSSDTAYQLMSGTSMACPHVAGVTALVKSINPDFTFGEVRQILLEAVDTDLVSQRAECGGLSDSAFPNHHFGFGRINALKAVQAAQALLNKA